MRHAALLLGLLLLPTGLAAEALSLETARPVHLAGAVEVRMPGGSLSVNVAEASDPVDLVGLTGRATLWTWKVARVQGGTGEGPWFDLAPQADDAVGEPFDLVDATLRVSPSGGPFHMVVQAREDGVVAVSGTLDEVGVSKRLLRRADEPVVSYPPVRRPAEDVTWYYEAGWTYSGNDLLGETAPAFPFPAHARAHVEGDVLLKLSHGNVEFTTADGRVVHASLGARPDAPGSPVETHRRLLFEGRLARADAPAGDAWALAGPAPQWVLDGRAAWRNATGQHRSGDGTRAFEDRLVEAEGRLAIRLPGDAVDEAGPRPERYEADGAFSTTLDGVPAAAPHPQAVPATAQAAGVAVGLLALAALAWKIAVASYTRLDPQVALKHPRRRAIHEAVRSHPGERVREVQRRVGLAWGAFSFHLDVLRRTGHVHLVREGAYLLVVPAVPPRGAPPLIPHPSARAVYDALPTDGSALPLRDLRDRLGFSRQLLDHHLHALAARGVVELVRRPDGARDARRAPPPPAGRSA